LNTQNREERNALHYRVFDIGEDGELFFPLFFKNEIKRSSNLEINYANKDHVLAGN
jgi:hypothetical protein